jgi:hypothetical protein
MISALARSPQRLRPLIVCSCVAGLVYVSYMFGVDVPRYWARWSAEQASGHHTLSLLQGMLDVADRRVVSYRWTTWQSEITWMTLYFSVAVWVSISLIHVAVGQARSGMARMHAVSVRAPLTVGGRSERSL